MTIISSSIWESGPQYTPQDLDIPKWLQAIERRVVDSWPKFEAMLEDLSTCTKPAMDIETTGLSPVDDKIVSIQFAGRPDRAYFIPVAMQGMHNLPLVDVIYRLERIWNDGVIGHNIGFDWKFVQKLKDFHIDTDTLLAAKCLPELWVKPGRFNLKDLSSHIFKFETIEIKDLFPPKTKRNTMRFDMVHPGNAVPYGCQDVVLCVMLNEWLNDKIERQSFIYTLEHDIIKPIARMELLGVRLDVQGLTEAGEAAANDLLQLEQDIYQLAGKEFNIDSNQQLGQILFTDLKLAVVSTTATGAPSVGNEVLVKLRRKHPVVEKLLDYKGLAKLKNSFLDALPTYIASDGLLHTSFSQWGAITGRGSASDPNVQQIPKKRGKYGDQYRVALRRGFLPPPGYIGFLDQDYSQLEYRIFASIANEPVLLKAFEDGEDPHKRMGARIKGIPYEDVDPILRERAKTSLFGGLYGQGDQALADAWGISLYEARKITSAIWASIPVGKAYLDTLKSMAREKGYCETYFGRRRPLPNINHKIKWIRSEAERHSVNSPVQGAGGDIIKIAISRASKVLESFKSRLVLMVHDQLVTAHHPDDNLDDLTEAMREAMELEVPGMATKFLTEAKYGPNWYDMEKREYSRSRQPVLRDDPGVSCVPDVILANNQDAVRTVCVPVGVEICDPVPGVVVGPEATGYDREERKPDRQPAGEDRNPEEGASPIIRDREDLPSGNGQAGTHPASADDFIRINPVPNGVARVRSLLQARPGQTMVYIAGMEDTQLSARIDSELLMALRKLGASFDIGEATRARVRAAVGGL